MRAGIARSPLGARTRLFPGAILEYGAAITFPVFPPEFIYAGTILSAIAGVALGVYFYLKGRAWPGVL